MAEQSVEGNVYAFDQKLQQKWKFTLSDIVESSAPPAAEDIYGVYIPYLQPLVWWYFLMTPSLYQQPMRGTKWCVHKSISTTSPFEVWRDSEKVAQKVANATLKFPVVDESNNQMILSVEKTSSESESQDVEQIQTGGIQVLSL